MAGGKLTIVLGDQLDPDAAALARLDPEHDAVLMMELADEASYVPQHKQRLVLFFSAMRHFAARLRDRGLTVHYHEIEQTDAHADGRADFATYLRHVLEQLAPASLRVTMPGDTRVLSLLRKGARAAGLELEVLPDRHFICEPQRFDAHADAHRGLLMEYFYRMMRRETGVLMDGRNPQGGRWNFDASNRKPFGSEGPGAIPPPRSFPPDTITKSVMRMVEQRFPGHPGSTRGFDLAVDQTQAQAALDDFIHNRLSAFGPYQDAMARGHGLLYHSRLSTVLNLHLLDPRTALRAAEHAWQENAAPIESVEGFVRQILGWREYVRGVYWREMPGYAGSNALDAQASVPEAFWSGETDMACVRDSMRTVLEHAYAHHIQRLMVLGQYALLLGVNPYQLHEWHMAMYADAIDWVSLPNVLGMSQYADGGLVGSKPYCASGNYVNRMSDYCAGCRFDPKQATGDRACPLTTLYWDFLSRNRNRLRNNPRMSFQFKNLDRKSDAERREIRGAADRLKQSPA
ncbi:MAG: cryptochrome/photolyase family protein [Gammaproteobacteria bacterium]|nr:cryptochrome/photolyase family protein [Gammaproteobacteria bacterium]